MEPKPRTTRQRTAIADVLADQDAFLSAQQLHDVLNAQGKNVGLTTVYRTVTAMAEAGDVDAIRTPDGEIAYRRCAATTGDHHHHLVCRTCGAAQIVSDDLVESWAAKISEKYGFTHVAHDLEFFGLCSDCSA